MRQPRETGQPTFVGAKVLRVDVLSGVVLIVIGAAAWLETASLDAGTLRYFGPGMLPRAFSAALVAIGLAVLVVGLRQREAVSAYFRASLRGPLAIATALLAFAAAIRGVDIGGLRIPQLGLIVAAPIAVLLAGYASREANLRDLGALALGMTAGCAALFNDVLGMAIPVLPKAVELAAAGSIGVPMAARVAYIVYAVLAVAIVLFPRSSASRDRETQERE